MNEPSRSNSVTDVSVALNMSGSSSEEYYQAVVISTLLSVLKDPSLNLNHHAAIEAIMNIFRTQGLKAVAFLPQVPPCLFPSVSLYLT
jgi:serine/threonine-protein kinase mTOR